jgi:hypothetical protein
MKPEQFKMFDVGKSKKRIPEDLAVGMGVNHSLSSINARPTSMNKEVERLMDNNCPAMADKLRKQIAKLEQLNTNPEVAK